MRKLTKLEQEMRRKHTRYFGGNVQLTIEDQSFTIMSGSKRRNIIFYRDMLAIALARLVTKHLKDSLEKR